MSELVLHHYDLSPYSEKVRLIFGLKGLAWRSVQIPVVMPEEVGSGVVHGELLASSVHEIAIRRRSERAGELVVHFPREDYLVVKT